MSPLTGDPYQVLGVSRDAGDRELKSAFRRLARELHPDVNRHDPAAEAKFKEAAEAYEILSDPERRSLYDRYGHEGLRGAGQGSPFEGFGSVGDIFEAFFGGRGSPFGDVFGGGARGGGAVAGGDVAVSVEIDLATAARGESVDVEYDAVSPCERCHGNGAEPGTPIETCERCGGAGQLRSVTRTPFGQVVQPVVCERCEGEGKIAETPCSRCEGRGREVEHRRLSVDVPAGIADDQRIRLSGRGHAGERGGRAGDLYVVVRVRDDDRFVRDGNDLVTVVDLSAPEAALGTRVRVPTLEGEQEVEVRPGTQPGDIVTLHGRGMPSLGRGRRGDQRVVVNVVVPRELSRHQRELLERFRDTLEERNVRPAADDGLFARVRRAMR
jgi:molecular chaperone DnaJ